MSNLECEKEFARRAANPIASNQDALDAKRYHYLRNLWKRVGESNEDYDEYLDIKISAK
jgi:hypothetical protein